MGKGCLRLHVLNRVQKCVTQGNSGSTLEEGCLWFRG